MHKLKRGSGTPLLFLHGFLGHPHDWNSLVSHLPSWPCFALDLPGHNQTPFTPAFTIPFFDQPFHLIGYSMGGRLAIEWAARHPERIASLTLLSTHPGLKADEERNRRLASDRAWAELLEQLPIDEFLKRWYAQPLFCGFIPDLALRRQHDVKSLAKALMHYSLAHQPLRSINALRLVGEKDEKFRALYSNGPNACVIPDAGHAIHLQNPKAVAAILTGALS